MKHHGGSVDQHIRNAADKVDNGTEIFLIFCFDNIFGNPQKIVLAHSLEFPYLLWNIFDQLISQNIRHLNTVSIITFLLKFRKLSKTVDLSKSHTVILDFSKHI